MMTELWQRHVRSKVPWLGLACCLGLAAPGVGGNEAAGESGRLKAPRPSMPWAQVGEPLLHQDRTPFEAEADIAQSLSTARPEVRLQRMGDLLVFHNNRIGAVFLDEAGGMGLANVMHVTRALGFGAKPTGEGFRGLLWRLELRTDAGRGRSLQLSNRAPAERQAVVTATEDGAVLSLSWSGLAVADEPSAVDVSVSVALRRGDPRSTWRIQVDNRSREWSLWAVYFPELDLGRIGDTPEDDVLVIPRAEGRAMRNPIHGWSLGLLTGASQPHGHGYPGGAHMQFCAYYEKKSDQHQYSGERGPGLYLAAEDGEMNVKRFFYTNVPDTDMLCYELQHYPPDMVTPGSDYEMPFDFVMRTYEGDWYDAARIYRAWALQQLWCRLGPFERREDIPRWFREADFFFRADSRKGATTYFREMCREALTTLHPPVCCHWYNWMNAEYGGHDLMTYLPARNGIAEAWRGSRAEGIHVFPYVNAQIWNRESESFAQARPHAVKNEHGEVEFWAGTEHAQMCRAEPWYRGVVADVCGTLVHEYGAGGLYLDQLGNAFNGLCLDPTHGHALGGGNHAVMGARAVFEDVRAKAGADIALVCEASSEENIDVAAGKIIHYNVWPGFVPLFAAVYHDMWSFYGRTAGGNEGDPFGSMNTGSIFVIGGQIGRIWPGKLPDALRGEGDEWWLAQARLLKRVVSARRASAKFLRYGEMLRPLHLAAQLPTLETHRWLGHKRAAPFPAVLPAVLTSVWRAADGNIGIVLVNIAGAPVRFEGWFVPEDYGLAGTRVPEWRHVWGQGAGLALEGPSLQLRTDIAAHDVQVLELSR